MNNGTNGKPYEDTLEVLIMKAHLLALGGMNNIVLYNSVKNDKEHLRQYEATGGFIEPLEMSLQHLEHINYIMDEAVKLLAAMKTVEISKPKEWHHVTSIACPPEDKRTPLEISTTLDKYGDVVAFVVADDGTMWRSMWVCGNEQWVRLPDLPQDDVKKPVNKE